MNMFWCLFIMGVIFIVILSIEIHKDDEDEYWN